MKKIGTWSVISSSIKELNLNVVLSCGQSFRWQQKEDGQWMSVLANHIWSLKQSPETGDILYQVHLREDASDNQQKNKRLKRSAQNNTKSSLLTEEDSQKILNEYFQLSVDVGTLYAEWTLADKHFQKVSEKFPGVRILRQDPTENLFSFICSSNNNISRISSMVQKLCENWGECLGEVNGEAFFSFPTVEALAQPDVEAKLRNLGFGYRAKYISQTARILHQEKEPNWLQSLRTASYDDAHKGLIELSGVGAKVADCVCLMSLDKGNAIPVDTHVWQIATRDYLPHLKKNKSLTDKTYKEIGDFFRGRFGDYAGWAHSVLFCSDLKKFSSKES